MASTDPAMAAAPAQPADDDSQASGGFTIEIVVAADGTMTGSIESADAESDEQGEAGEPAGQPLADVAAACSFVEDAINNKGQVADAVESDPDQMTDAQVWDQGAKARAS